MPCLWKPLNSEYLLSRKDASLCHWYQNALMWDPSSVWERDGILDIKSDCPAHSHTSHWTDGTKHLIAKPFTLTGHQVSTRPWTRYGLQQPNVHASIYTTKLLSPHSLSMISKHVCSSIFFIPLSFSAGTALVPSAGSRSYVTKCHFA